VDIVSGLCDSESPARLESLGFFFFCSLTHSYKQQVITLQPVLLELWRILLLSLICFSRQIPFWHSFVSLDTLPNPWKTALLRDSYFSTPWEGCLNFARSSFFRSGPLPTWEVAVLQLSLGADRFSYIKFSIAFRTNSYRIKECCCSHQPSPFFLLFFGFLLCPRPR